jgi:hypothetical protein
VDGALQVKIRNAGRERDQRVALDGPLFPASAMAFYPITRGLALRRAYRYRVYSSETQRVLDVEQRVRAYEKSDLFLGDAFRVQTAALGHGSTTWIDARGQPLLEMALNGVMISALEGESEAKRYLALAALNKRETLVSFSLVTPDHALVRPRETRRLTVVLSGAPWPPPSDDRQRCAASHAGSGPRAGSSRETVWTCTIRVGGTAASAGDDQAHLQPSVTVPSDARLVQDTAAAIAGEGGDAEQRIESLLAWIGTNIRRTPVDAFSALDVLERREAECQGHAYLFAALARSLGIPTRVVNGLTYSEQFHGFLYHTWVESRLGAQWQAIDPTFGQRQADATHLKLLEGESTGDLLPLVEWMGKVSLRVEAAEPADAARTP